MGQQHGQAAKRPKKTRTTVYEGQGETYDQIQARMRRIKITIDLIEDRMIGESEPLEIPERWRQK